MAETITEPLSLTRKDFVSDEDVRWCPGCGDYAILAQMQRVLPELGIPKEKIVFVSGIGCSSRFPYYMDTYGIHSIHGRAPTFASGLKVANPELSIWIITGDGDGLSIGGNHLIHCLRRNLDINILLFNNRIYGLTKGQYSPTSLRGHITKSSPMGAIEHSFNPTSVAIGAEATFVARTVDRNTKHLADTLRRVVEHKGTSFVEIYQNCNIYNDGAWSHVTEANVKEENALYLEHGKPMIFGKERNKGIRMNGLTPEVVTLGNGNSKEGLLVHNENTEQPALAYLLSRMDHPEFPVPLGVFRSVKQQVYEEQLANQGKAAVELKGEGDLSSLYHSADTWIVSQIPGKEHLPDWEVSDNAEITKGTPEIPGISQEDPYSPKTDFQHLMTDPISSLDLPLPECIPPDTSLEDAISLIKRKNTGCLLVIDSSDKLIGIFAQGDVFSKIAGQKLDLEHTTVDSLMTRNPTTLNASDPISHAVHLMSLHGFRHIPIVDNKGRPIMISSFREGLRFISKLIASQDETG